MGPADLSKGTMSLLAKFDSHESVFAAYSVKRSGGGLKDRCCDEVTTNWAVQRRFARCESFSLGFRQGFGPSPL